MGKTWKDFAASAFQEYEDEATKLGNQGWEMPLDRNTDIIKMC